MLLGTTHKTAPLLPLKFSRERPPGLVPAAPAAPAAAGAGGAGVNGDNYWCQDLHLAVYCYSRGATSTKLTFWPLKPTIDPLVRRPRFKKTMTITGYTTAAALLNHPRFKLSAQWDSGT